MSKWLEDHPIVQGILVYFLMLGLMLAVPFVALAEAVRRLCCRERQPVHLRSVNEEGGCCE